jgi:hypothetical protein
MVYHPPWLGRQKENEAQRKKYQASGNDVSRKIFEGGTWKTAALRSA